MKCPTCGAFPLPSHIERQLTAAKDEQEKQLAETIQLLKAILRELKTLNDRS